MFYLENVKLSRLVAALFGGFLTATATFAQTEPLSFPTFTAEDPQRIGIISKLSAEQKAGLISSIDAADLYGLFPTDLEADPEDSYGILLYVLSAWSDVEEIPAQNLPRAALPQLREINPAYFRYAIPMRNPDGRLFALVFYVAPNPTPEVLQCLAQDLVVVMHAGFESGDIAACARG